MNRRDFLTACLAGLVVGPSIVRETLARRLGPVRSVVCVDFRAELDPNRFIYLDEKGMEYAFLVRQEQRGSRFFHYPACRVEGQKRYEVEWFNDVWTVHKLPIKQDGSLDTSKPYPPPPTITITWQEWIT